MTSPSGRGPLPKRSGLLEPSSIHASAEAPSASSAHRDREEGVERSLAQVQIVLGENGCQSA